MKNETILPIGWVCSGKSTLLRMLAGLNHLLRGRIIIDGVGHV